MKCSIQQQYFNLATFQQLQLRWKKICTMYAFRQINIRVGQGRVLEFATLCKEWQTCAAGTRHYAQCTTYSARQFQYDDPYIKGIFQNCSSGYCDQDPPHLNLRYQNQISFSHCDNIQYFCYDSEMFKYSSANNHTYLHSHYFAKKFHLSYSSTQVFSVKVTKTNQIA